MTTASITITASDKTQAAFRSVENNLAGVSNRMGAVMGAVAGLAGAAGLGMLVKTSMQSADALAKTSDALGIATEKLATMRYMGDLAGVSAEQMDANLKKMTQSLGEAANGGGAAAKTLEMLRLDAQQLVQLSPDQQYLAIADAINSLGTQAEKAAAANDIFGRSGVNMLNVMAGGSETFLQAEEEANKFGIAISRLDAAKIEMANDSFTRLGTVVQGMGNAMAITAAPMLDDLANKFINLIGGADGFRNAAQFMTDVTVNAVGLLADGFHGLHIVFDGIGAAFWTVVEKLMQGLDWLQKQVVEFLNLLPGVDIKPMESFTKATQFAADTAEAARRNLQALVMEPLPSDKIKQWSQEVQQKAQEAAAKMAAVSQAAGGQGVLDTGAPVDDKAAAKEAERRAAEEAREQQRMQERLARLQEHYMSEQQLLAQNLEANQFLLEDSFQNGLITDTERQALLQQMADEHEKKLTDIKNRGLSDRQKFEQMTTMEQTEFVLGELGNMLSGVASNNKTLFKLNKAASIAMAIMNTSEGVTKSLAKYPYPLNIGMAAATFAAGMAQVNSIKSQQFGGGGSASSPSAGGGSGIGGNASNAANTAMSALETARLATANNPPAQKNGSVNIYIQGAITEDMIREIVVPVIKEDVDNRDLVLISSYSRNGQVLMGS